MHNKFIIDNLLLHLFLHWLNNFQQSHLPQVGQKIKSESVLEVKNFSSLKISTGIADTYSDQQTPKLPKLIK